MQAIKDGEVFSKNFMQKNRKNPMAQFWEKRQRSRQTGDWGDPYRWLRLATDHNVSGGGVNMIHPIGGGAFPVYELFRSTVHAMCLRRVFVGVIWCFKCKYGPNTKFWPYFVVFKKFPIIFIDQNAGFDNLCKKCHFQTALTTSLIYWTLYAFDVSIGSVLLIPMSFIHWSDLVLLSRHFLWNGAILV